MRTLTKHLQYMINGYISIDLLNDCKTSIRHTRFLFMLLKLGHIPIFKQNRINMIHKHDVSINTNIIKKFIGDVGIYDIHDTDTEDLINTYIDNFFYIQTAPSVKLIKFATDSNSYIQFVFLLIDDIGNDIGYWYNITDDRIKYDRQKNKFYCTYYDLKIYVDDYIFVKLYFTQYGTLIKATYSDLCKILNSDSATLGWYSITKYNLDNETYTSISKIINHCSNNSTYKMAIKMLENYQYDRNI